MADLAKYIRIYDPSPADDAVTKREAAVRDSVAQLRKTTNVQALVGLGAAGARAFVTGTVPDPLGAILATAIKKQASAFVREERELETTVLAGAALIEFFESSDAGNNIVLNKDVLGATLWSALAYQKPSDDPKLEQLRQDLLSVVAERVLRRAEASRKRSVAKEVPAAEAELGQLTKSLGIASASLEAVIANAVLDREEIDVLWWALGGRSPTVGRAYESLAAAVRAVVRGVELGILLRRLPSQSLRSVALSGVPEIDALPLADLIVQLADVREALAAKVPARPTIAANAIAFPLLTAIIDGTIAEGEATTIDEWCGRALLEAGLAALCENPATRL